MKRILFNKVGTYGYLECKVIKSERMQVNIYPEII